MLLCFAEHTDKRSVSLSWPLLSSGVSPQNKDASLTRSRERLVLRRARARIWAAAWRMSSVLRSPLPLPRSTPLLEPSFIGRVNVWLSSLRRCRCSCARSLAAFRSAFAFLRWARARFSTAAASASAILAAMGSFTSASSSLCVFQAFNSSMSIILLSSSCCFCCCCSCSCLLKLRRDESVAVSILGSSSVKLSIRAMMSEASPNKRSLDSS
mmetsp:Transcript_16120/g.34836  ORF Transcript_16120/g.34836 Transcript_16120/m.34836 type:complete len:212 (+) Transcript_16120:1391-2026(+)